LERSPYLALAIVLLTLASNRLAAAEPPDPTLELKQTIPLTGVEGRIDHLDLDIAGERLFVCALGNNSVEVLDLRKGERIHSISGLGTPQSVAYISELNRLFVANDNGGLCNIYDAKAWQLLSTTDLQDDADNMRYDTTSKEVFVGFGTGGIAVINVADGKRTGLIKLAAHPEAFELEKHGRRMFVNLPAAGQVAVVDRDKAEVIARWKPDGAAANFPMALDEANHRLFIACRTPAKLVVLDTDSGTTVTALDISGDADEVFYDAKHRRLYAICGEGYVDIIEQTDADHYNRTAKIPTASGARTGFFNSERDDLFVAVPHHGTQGAEIRRYRLTSKVKGTLPTTGMTAR
jgi:DNA-binding beta-propeller fold protein YncE